MALLLLLNTDMKVTLVVTMTSHCCCDTSRQGGQLIALLLLLTTEVQVTKVMTKTSHCCGGMSRQG